MFHFPTFLQLPIHSTSGHTHNRNHACGVSPFGHPGITARLSTPPGLCRFLNVLHRLYYQGIHRAPLATYPTTTQQRSGCSSPQTEQTQPTGTLQQVVARKYTNNPTSPHHPKRRCKQQNQQEIKDARVHYTVTNNNTPTNTTTTMHSVMTVMPRAQPPTTTNSDD